MKLEFRKRGLIDITLTVMFVGGFVVAAAFGACLHYAKKEVERQTDMRVELGISMVKNHIDEELGKVEDIAYTLLSSDFGKIERSEDGKSFVTIDPQRFDGAPTEEAVFVKLEQFLKANPKVYGASIGFEKDLKGLYDNNKDEFGFCAYVTYMDGEMVRASLGRRFDYHERPWYKDAIESGGSVWTNFQAIYNRKVVTCFSVPVHGYGNRSVGVFTLVIDTGAFAKSCEEVAPYADAQVLIVDKDFRFICHPDTSLIYKKVSETAPYNEYKSKDDSMMIKLQNHQSGTYTVDTGNRGEAFMYFEPIERNGWMLSVECPKASVFAGINDIKDKIWLIALLCMAFILVSFFLLFKRIDKEARTMIGMDKELDIASKLQMGLVPKKYPAFPDMPDLDVCGFLKASKGVGGDLYNYFVKDGKLMFCLGDVSGKGMPAALFMAITNSVFRVVAADEQNPSLIVQLMNDALCKGNEQGMFCTLFAGILDLSTGELQYCNAGHNAPVICRSAQNGGDIYFEKVLPNLPLGAFDGFPYQGQTTHLSKGDAIFLYTDGVTEAENRNKDLFGDDRTLDTIRDSVINSGNSQQVLQDMYSAVLRHADGADQNDDITMLMIRYR